MSAEPKRSVPAIDTRSEFAISSVYSSIRQLQQPEIDLPRELKYNQRLKMEGTLFLSKLPEDSIPIAFLDPQYRGVLDHLKYGNEGVKRGAGRSALPQMDDKEIARFIQALDRVLMPMGHLFLWVDKFHLCSGFQNWLLGSNFSVVDMVTWDKEKLGMGYRTRRKSEHLVILQQAPRKARGVWKLHDIPDLWSETVRNRAGVHPKPVRLQARLIEAVSNSGDVVIDPAAGFFSVLEACQNTGRNFLGCDIHG